MWHVLMPHASCRRVSKEAQGSALSLGAMGLVPDSDDGLLGAELVGGKTTHRSSFHIWKASETQVHSLSCFFIRAFPHLFKLPH